MAKTQAEGLSPRNGLSHVVGSEAPALKMQTIPALMRETVGLYGDREALVLRQTGTRLTWREFDQAIDETAMGLLALGIEKADRVGIWSPNRLEWVLTQFATARIGAILVNINPAYRLAELEYALEKVGCKALIAAPRFKSSDYHGMIRTLLPDLAEAVSWGEGPAKLPELRHVVMMEDDPGPGMMSFEALRAMGQPVDQAALDAIDAMLDPHDPINIQFTSGTTGNPKGATLSHFNITNNAHFVTDRISLTDADRLVIPVPLYHCFGMVMGVLGVVTKGACMIFPGEGFDPVETLDAVAEERATALYGVPTMFVAMLQDLDKTPRDLSSLRTGIMAGSLCPIEVMERVNADMHMGEVTICYGMTETSPVSFQSFTDDPTDKRCETVGRIHPHLEVKLVDEAGASVPVGQSGELWTRGYSVMKGYWGDAAASAACIEDGWMKTGDLASLDEDGFCTIVGRSKDMIIRGGENISPREIEDFLIRHPKVAEVQVFGIPCERFGEQVCAWVIPAPDVELEGEELRAHCQGQIAHFKVPLHIRIVEALPMTVTGKPQKFIMRAEMVAILEREAGS